MFCLRELRDFKATKYKACWWCHSLENSTSLGKFLVKTNAGSNTTLRVICKVLSRISAFQIYFDENEKSEVIKKALFNASIPTLFELGI